MFAAVCITKRMRQPSDFLVRARFRLSLEGTMPGSIPMHTDHLDVQVLIADYQASLRRAIRIRLHRIERVLKQCYHDAIRADG